MRALLEVLVRRAVGSGDEVKTVILAVLLILLWWVVASS
jgi:hypothetical protein